MHPLVPLLQLVHMLSRVEGRKKLQKTVHILQEMGYPFRERFEYSLYGMYSPQLRGEIDLLAHDGLIAEKAGKAGANDSFVLEPSPTLAPFLKSHGLDLPPDWAASAWHLNSLSPSVLEGISTVRYLHRTGTPAARLRARLLELKPHLAKQANTCLTEARKLKLI